MLMASLTAVDMRLQRAEWCLRGRESGDAAGELLATVLYVRRGANEAAVGTLCELGNAPPARRRPRRLV